MGESSDGLGDLVALEGEGQTGSRLVGDGGAGGFA